MANIASAKKRAKQAIVRRARNMSMRSEMRTYIKKVMTAIEAGNKAEAQELFKLAAGKIDKFANNGLIHKNKAARSKSRLNQRIKSMA